MSIDKELGELSAAEMDRYAAAFLRALDAGSARVGAADALALAFAKKLGGDGGNEESPGKEKRAGEEGLLSAAGKAAALLVKMQQLSSGDYDMSAGESRRGNDGYDGEGESGEKARKSVLPAAESFIEGDPHRRYENAVGRRRLEMDRVSDYFRRDSRRYDSGFDKY